ncbi:potassium channel family protein [Tessaracoccus caeni]|uniref:potassium channel family protein n=1 Tax=Tessaracoccus caeni TaxID=3031239 RepID=UPI0023DABAFD|nr:TrkA family potassium uptake protein [Tessaracoccus caeni]MDF1488512.1 TrkA family potassium uptake protein [Tessaracoccus caeni]
MRVAIAGAGNVGLSIARELLANGHHVLLIERNVNALEPDTVPGAEWLRADACELATLEDAELDGYDVAIAATGDDKANLVHSLLAKTEFGVPRTVARVNRPDNEWLFGEMWGVDVAVSTPRLMSALVEEAVSTGDLIRLLSFNKSTAHLSEITLPQDSPLVGCLVRDLALPRDVVLTAIIRDGAPLTPERERAIEGGDELLFILPQEAEEELTAFFEHQDDEADEDAP